MPPLLTCLMFLLSVGTMAIAAPSASPTTAKPAPGGTYPGPILANETPAPDFTVTGRDGKAIRLIDYRGKTVVLDFWATWCGVCLIPLHHAAASAQQYADQGIVVLAIDVMDTPNALRNWLPNQKWLPAPSQAIGPIFAVDPSLASKSVARLLYNVSELPTQYVIGKDGRIVGAIVGLDMGNKRLEEALKNAGV